MRDIIGIICEYNPFHKGHKYQIDKIREMMPEATLIGIMSGNVVQRGELSLVDKYVRALIASECGLDGVFEIPYPYCGSTAEIFASAGVEIAYNLGCNYICFGTENSSVEKLEKIADIIDTNEFKAEVEKKTREDINHLKAKELALKGLGYEMPEYSNDILALEYIRAIKNKSINLKYFTVERVGARYNDITENEIMSASAIRAYFHKQGKITSIPDCVKPYYDRLINEGNYVISNEINDFLYHYAVITPREVFDDCFDSCSEIGAIIKDASKNAKNSEEFFNYLNSKSYTTSRIKRVLLYALTGICEVDKTPLFSILLSSNDKCKELLKNIRKNESFLVITKMADSKKLDEKSKKQLDALLKLDELYVTFLKSKKAPKSVYGFNPILK